MVEPVYVEMVHHQPSRVAVGQREGGARHRSSHTESSREALNESSLASSEVSHQDDHVSDGCRAGYGPGAGTRLVHIGGHEAVGHVRAVIPNRSGCQRIHPRQATTADSNKPPRT